MKSNESILLPIVNKFNNQINKSVFVVDKTGVKMVELLCETIKLNPLQPHLKFGDVRKSPVNYINKEHEWYLSQNLSIINYVDTIKIWNDICTKDEYKQINSNYGWCIFSNDNYNQYDFSLNELLSNKYSRRACMIYTRPSITKDYNRNGMSDYICTFNTQQFIRDDKLIYVVNMRSNDFIKGFFSDFPWHCYVYNKIYNDLKIKYTNLVSGHIIWVANSLHVYESDFDLINKMNNVKL